MDGEIYSYTRTSAMLNHYPRAAVAFSDCPKGGRSPLYLPVLQNAGIFEIVVALITSCSHKNFMMAQQSIHPCLFLKHTPTDTTGTENNTTFPPLRYNCVTVHDIQLVIYGIIVNSAVTFSHLSTVNMSVYQSSEWLLAWPSMYVSQSAVAII